MDEAQIEQLFGMLKPEIQQVVMTHLKPREYYVRMRTSLEDIRAESLGTVGKLPSLYAKYRKVMSKVRKFFKEDDRDTAQYYLAMAYLCMHIGVEDFGDDREYD